MKERLFKRDLPLLQSSGLKAKNALAGIVARRVERPMKYESKSFDGATQDPKAFPSLQQDLSALQRKPRVASHSFSRENSNSESKALSIKRERTNSVSTHSYRCRPLIRKPVKITGNLRC